MVNVDNQQFVRFLGETCQSYRLYEGNKNKNENFFRNFIKIFDLYKYIIFSLLPTTIGA